MIFVVVGGGRRRRAYRRYLSGEDPFLGYTLVQPVIRGIQSQKVVANAKHYINNNQETNRNNVSEIVDERTRFEMYYPPFAGAVEADVGSIMCSCVSRIFPTEFVVCFPMHARHNHASTGRRLLS